MEAIDQDRSSGHGRFRQIHVHNVGRACSRNIMDLWGIVNDKVEGKMEKEPRKQ